MAAASNRFRLAAWAFVALLVALRIPSLAQPPGADQALYAYVGQRLLHGELPYRDAWDQKPPAVHFTYAAMLAIWPHPSVVAGADLVATTLTAWLLAFTAARLSTMRGAGLLTAILYLLFANPAYTRLGGVRIRAQCESFIGLFVAAALALLVRRLGDGSSGDVPRREAMLAGLCVGVAGVYKYNALVYALPLGVALSAAAWGSDTNVARRLNRLVKAAAWAGLGAALPIAAMAALFAATGVLEDLYLATITYNVRYSGETYGGARDFLRYLVTFPVRHARLDSLWMLGGAGTAVLIAASWRQPAAAIAPAWVAAACLAIAINGSRGLPQYFVQAWPALALAAGVAGGVVWPRLPMWGRIALVAATALAVPRVTQFDKMLATTWVDASRLAGAIDRAPYLARFGRADSGDKYSALAIDELSTAIKARTAPSDTILVFGFSPWAYVDSGRRSASRFFWSRPVIIGFESHRPGYGVPGLLAELEGRTPRLVALQARDWDPDGPNSRDFFLADRRLSAWLQAHYLPAGTIHNFDLWMRADLR